jgi:2-hydroxy-6-oxonona-2,4-dienedioate hydrolase
VARVGRRAPLLLLHGGSGSWTHWVRNIAPLVRAAAAAVWVPDMPGFGDSALPPGCQDADQLPPWLEQGLQQLLGRTPVDVVGFSFGALVAGYLATAHPASAWPACCWWAPLRSAPSAAAAAAAAVERHPPGPTARRRAPPQPAHC